MHIAVLYTGYILGGGGGGGELFKVYGTVHPSRESGA